MSYLFFSDILMELGHKLNYDAVMNYAGNSFCKDSWKMIEEANPMTISNGKSVLGGMVDIFEKAIVVQTDKSAARKYSWDEDEEEG